MTAHERFMRIALREAEQAASEGEIPVGAVIVRGEDVLAQTHNQREQTHDPTAHAEILAIREAAAALQNRRLTDCSLYVTLEPCPMCAGAMVMLVWVLAISAQAISVRDAWKAYTRSPPIPRFIIMCTAPADFCKPNAKHCCKHFFKPNDPDTRRIGYTIYKPIRHADKEKFPCKLIPS